MSTKTTPVTTRLPAKQRVAHAYCRCNDFKTALCGWIRRKPKAKLTPTEPKPHQWCVVCLELHKVTGCPLCGASA